MLLYSLSKMMTDTTKGTKKIEAEREEEQDDGNPVLQPIPRDVK